MPLTSLQVNNSLTYQLQTAGANGYTGLSAGPNTIQFVPTAIDLTSFTQIYDNHYTLANSASQTFDMFSCVNQVNESVVFTAVYGFILVVDAGTNGNILVQPGASNALQWFLNGSTQGVNIPNGSGVSYQNSLTGSGITVDSTHRNILITNTGSASVGFYLAVWGKA